jgi:hypothetical protein
MIVLWFYMVMSTGLYTPSRPGWGMEQQKPKEIHGPFQTHEQCNLHRGTTDDQDGMTRCVSIKVRWMGSSPPRWAWYPGKAK